MSNGKEGQTTPPELKIIDGTIDETLEIRRLLRSGNAEMDKMLEGIITPEELAEEVAQRLMDNIPQPPFDTIERRARRIYAKESSVKRRGKEGE